MLEAKEHYDLMTAFERQHRERFDKETKDYWPKGIIYQDGRVNAMFLAFRKGYAYGKHDAQTAIYDLQDDLQNVIASRDGYKADVERLSAALTAQKVGDGDDKELFDWLRDSACDLRSISSGEDDYCWVVIEHYMAKPHEREIGRSHTDDPRDAIRAAMQQQSKGEQ